MVELVVARDHQKKKHVYMAEIGNPIKAREGRLLPTRAPLCLFML